jgi:hypothetical protein
VAFSLLAVAPKIFFRFARLQMMHTALDPQIAQLDSFLKGLQDPADTTWRDFVLDVHPKIELAVTHSSIHINFLLAEFSDDMKYRKTILNWWTTGSQPSQSIAKLTVSSGISYEDIMEKRYGWGALDDGAWGYKETSQSSWFARRA